MRRPPDEALRSPGARGTCVTCLGNGSSTELSAPARASATSTTPGTRHFSNAISGSLKPGHGFSGDRRAAESVLAEFRDRLEAEVSDIHFLAENRYEPSTGRIENRFTISRGEKVQSQLASHRVYTYRQITALLEKAGFGDFEAYGGFSGEPFRLGSLKLLLVARKEK